MIDKRPAAIAYCADEADVAAALRYGVEHGLRIAVRGGGHNGAGLGSVDDGLVIDLSQMNDDHRRRAAKMARVGGGALLKDLLEATHQHGLTVPGRDHRHHRRRRADARRRHGAPDPRHSGLTIDNLVAATVVLADGSVVQTDAEREPELFWALRGGGGNFGSRHVVLVPLPSRSRPCSPGRCSTTSATPRSCSRWYRDFLPAAAGRA